MRLASATLSFIFAKGDFPEEFFLSLLSSSVSVDTDDLIDGFITGVVADDISFAGSMESSIIAISIACITSSSTMKPPALAISSSPWSHSIDSVIPPVDIICTIESTLTEGRPYFSILLSIDSLGAIITGMSLRLSGPSMYRGHIPTSTYFIPLY